MLAEVQLDELGPPVVATADDPPQHHVRANLDSRLRAMLRHEPGTRSGVDAEDLHQARVAVRRMRAVLRAARPLLDKAWADDLRAPLGRLGAALGPVRDLDVLLARLHGEVAAIGSTDSLDATAAQPLLRALADERVAARAVLVDALDSDWHADLVRSLAAAVASPLPTRAGKRAPDLLSLLSRETARLERSVRAAGDSPPDAVLHELRVLGKRVRYTGELVEAAVPDPDARRRVKRLLKAMAAMQEVLGDHQDACVAQERVRALLASIGPRAGVDVAFAAGRLVEREEARRLDKRAAWPDTWHTVATAIADLAPPAPEHQPTEHQPTEQPGG